MNTTLATQAVQEPSLNAGQQAAADGFFQFLFSKDREMIISGPGGVGKTFLMTHLIDKIMPQYQQTCKLMGIDPEYTEVQMTATTNKAAEVLGAETRRPTQTIHSFLGLKVSEDFSTGKTRLTKTNRWKIHTNKIVFIDEAFAGVDSVMLTLIREAFLNCKIIYVGDHCQLSPVQEAVSPLVNQRLPFFELTEPMRTGNPHLRALNLQLRETVETGVFKPIQVVPGVIDHLDGPAMEAAIANTFQTMTNNSRILAYTNRRVVDYNNHIRYLRQLTGTYVEGERLVNNVAVTTPKKALIGVEEELTIDRLSPESTFIEIEDGVELEVRYANLHSPHSVYTDVPLPENKEHFTALVAHYRRAKKWNRYFFLRGNFPDLRPRDAATLHKAQGSSYDTVFIDLDNLSTCHNPNQAARLLYVGASRARHNVVLYGELAAKYGGLIHP